MDERLRIIPLADVEGIEIKCECGMEIIVSSLAPETSRLDPNCPGCGQSLATATQAVQGFKSFQAFVSQKEGRRVSYRIADTE